MTDLEELQKQLDGIRKELETLLPSSQAYQKLREEQTALEAQLIGSSAVAQGDSVTSVGEDGIGIGGNLDGNLIKGEQNQVFRNSTVILAGDGARILVGEHATEQNSKPEAQSITSYAATSTNILTFLFTDIEGSTQLWEQHPEAMKIALARHDTILREAIESHKGKVFKTVGDAFYAAFPNARNALKAAIAAQRAIQAEVWGETVVKVRMALHTGSVEIRDNDYFGPPLNRVARLMAAGHGGQVLLSTAFAELVRSSLPPDTSLRDMGERSLKDLIRPEHIYQLIAPGLQTDFPPLKTLEAFRTNLPVQLTSFIGREKEISAVKKLIVGHRLITLTGSGGTGKTRLSLQVAADLLDSFPDGVWFVEFAPLSDPALVPQVLLTTMGLREETGRPILEAINGYLQSKKVLLILDNCEHLVEAAAHLAESTLHACLNLRLLVSSREALGIVGETAYHVRSLSTPSRQAQSVESIIQYESVRLFVDRAQAVFSAFAITSANALAVAQVCARLDGIPLAIELAAARVKLLKVEQIAERLDDRFRLLTGGSRTALPRHQTLRAMIDWSYDLLPESERILLRRLSVFAGGWTLEAAETVCQGPGIDDYDVLEPLAQLVNKSLVVVDADDNVETRYHLLETVRQYAREKLSEIGEGILVRDAHLQYFLGLAERAETQFFSPNELEWQERIEYDLDNIRAALEWSLKGDPQIGLRLVSALRELWNEYGHARDGYHWSTQLLNHPQGQSHTLARARALCTRSFFLVNGAFESNVRPVLDESLALCRELDDKPGIALSLLYLGLFIFWGGDRASGKELILESLAIYRSLNDRPGMVVVLNCLGGIVDLNISESAQTYLIEALAICRETGSLFLLSRNLYNLAYAETIRGNYLVAYQWLEESLANQRRLGGSVLLYTLMNSAEVAVRTYQDVQARTYFDECLSIISQAGISMADTRWFFAKLGHLAVMFGDITKAKDFLRQSVEQFSKTGVKIGIVYAIEGVASLAVLQHHIQEAVQLFTWADSTRTEIANPRPHVEQADVDRDLATIRSQIDETTFAEAQAAGRTMSMDEAIELALEYTHD